MQQMFKKDLYVPHHAHNDECMYKVSDENDFIENVGEYMEVQKRDREVFSYFWLSCRKGVNYGYFTVLGFSEEME